MIMVIIIGAFMFVSALSLAGTTKSRVEFLGGLSVPPMVILLMFIGIFLLLGMFLDALGMLVLALPIMHPIALELGFDPIWFGILVIKMSEIGNITPPIGLNVYMVKAIAPEAEIADIFRGIFMFFLMDIWMVALMIAFPQIVLFLPDRMS